MTPQDNSKSSARPFIRFYDSNKPFYFLTNFFPSPIKFGGLQFANAEAAFQSAKFTSHPELQEQISKIEWPRFAFEKAQENKDLVRKDWEQTSIALMFAVQLHKYTQNINLGFRLLQTGDAELIEDSKNDTFWGAGADGKGSNHLGRILTLVRDFLKTIPFFLTLPGDCDLVGPSAPSSSLLWLRRERARTSLEDWPEPIRQMHLRPSLEAAPAERPILLHGLTFDEGSGMIKGIVQVAKGTDQDVPRIYTYNKIWDRWNRILRCNRVHDTNDLFELYEFEICFGEVLYQYSCSSFTFVAMVGEHSTVEYTITTMM
ncbi:unnamed protein product [Tilletia caries]|nr:unnamed protein product [Tilletia caries]CAD6921278.1 unnamed protein product [Tilletia controversa]CAD6975504.1 unnamed protein product [Tilletia controversa]